MAKKNKTKKKNTETNEAVEMINPCGDYCHIKEGHLCPECEDYADFRAVSESTPPSSTKPVQGNIS